MSKICKITLSADVFTMNQNLEKHSTVHSPQFFFLLGKEPRHFIKMFAVKMIIYQGGKASGFKNVHDHDTYDVDGTRLFQIRGTCPDDTRATQVDEKASSLNSEDVFVLETPGKAYVWIGSKSDNDELDIAKDIVQIVSPDHELETVQEGSEPDEFWDKLGGKGDYAKEAVHTHPGAKIVSLHRNERFQFETQRNSKVQED